MTFLIAHLALVTAALFAGAAVYVSFAEHPARAYLDDRAALIHWKPSYHQATKMQASLAMASSVFGLLAWITTGDARWIVGTLLMLANLPYTLFRMIPLNKTLEATAADNAGAASRALLQRWSRLHVVRDVLGLAATAAFVWALS